MAAVTWNPSDKAAGVTLSGGDLTASHAAASYEGVRATTSNVSGKWYFEVYVTGRTSPVGLLTSGGSLTAIIGSTTLGRGFYINGSGEGHKYYNAVTTQLLSGLSLPATICVAADLGADKVWFGVNGTWSGDPAAGTGEAFNNATQTYFPAWVSSALDSTSSGVGRFKSTDFVYSVPSGFSAWDPEVTIASVGSAVGTSTAVAYGGPFGTAAGVGTASAVGRTLKRSIGSAVGLSRALSRPLYQKLIQTNIDGTLGATLAICEKAYGVWNTGQTDLTGSAITNLNYTSPALSLDTTAAAREWVIRITLPSARSVYGVRLHGGEYSAGAVFDTIRLFSNGNTTYAAPTDGTTWDTGSANEYNLVGSYADRPYAEVTNFGGVDQSVDIIFNDTVYQDAFQSAKQLDLYIKLATYPKGVEVNELELIFTGVVYDIFLTETVSATGEATELRRIVTATSTANATAAATTYETQTEVSTANATATAALSSKSHTYVAVSTANATSTAIGERTLTLVSTANATATAPYMPLVLPLVSTANVTAVFVGLNNPSNTLVSTANATATALGLRSQTVTSTANATATAVVTRTGIETLVSSALATDTDIAVAQKVSTNVSTANATSVVSTQLDAHQILVSTANAEAYIILPDGSKQALWMNPVTTAVGTWQGVPFESMVQIGDQVYAAGDGGLYLLVDGADDNGAPIAAEMMWDLLDFGDPKKHRPGDVVIGGSADGELNIRVVNEQGRYNYPTHLSKNTKATNFRAKLGKGLTSRYIRFALTNPGGVDFGFNDGQVEVVALSRHIGGKHA